MKKINCLKNTVLLLAFLPFLPATIPQASAEQLTENSTVNSTYLAQASNYKRYMAQGYAATSRRNYRQALGYFQQALEAKPGDRYARAAINNVQGYLARRRNRPQIIAGRPTGTKAGARRGEICIEKNKDTIPLLPKASQNSDQDSQGNAGEAEAPKTSQARPSFFFYIPIRVEKKPEIFVFSLNSKNGNKQIFYQKYQPIEKPGIVRVTLPDTTPALEPGEYTWSFSAICDRNDFSKKDSVIQGQIQRTPLDSELQAFLQGLQGLEKVNWYASSGYWEDALTELAKLSINEETKAAWKELLGSGNIDLEAINAYPPAPLELQPYRDRAGSRR
ncbi:MAG: DUF928 domain-containing protein [Nostocales cyanobacterium 94392]|nr:DUF928 domain-containing protein [Nostocales cyanobacterium 94392]